MSIQVSIPFKREGTGEHKSPIVSIYPTGKKVSIPFKREGTCEQPLFCTQSGRGSVHPKPNANCARLFFCENSGQKSNKPL